MGIFTFILHQYQITLNFQYKTVYVAYYPYTTNTHTNTFEKPRLCCNVILKKIHHWVCNLCWVLTRL